MTGTVNNVELKKCPFCGHTASMIYDNQDGYMIYCDNNNCAVSTDYHSDKNVCIQIWNRRVCEE